jgi:acetyl-CoA carboxylase biotin carboxyl carrier protein
MNDTQTLRQLAGWIADAGIHELELTGPGQRLRLRRASPVRAEDPTRAPHPARAPHPVRAEVSKPPACPSIPQGERSGQAQGERNGSDRRIAATSVGVFLDRHPLRDTPLAPPGTQVRAGQIVALLRIGQLLLPVAAHKNGTVARIIAPHGSTVGYGTALLELTD